jgi:hypothetical protein
MTDTEFRKLVERMRAAQAAYFRTRALSDLVRSKELEAQVDRELSASGELFA